MNGRRDERQSVHSASNKQKNAVQHFIIFFTNGEKVIPKNKTTEKSAFPPTDRTRKSFGNKKKHKSKLMTMVLSVQSLGLWFPTGESVKNTDKTRWCCFVLKFLCAKEGLCASRGQIRVLYLPFVLSRSFLFRGGEVPYNFVACNAVGNRFGSPGTRH